MKRMAASFTIAARNNGFTADRGNAASRWRRCGPTGRRWPSSPQMGTMDLWYAHMSEDDLQAAMQAVQRGLRPAKSAQGQGQERQGQRRRQVRQGRGSRRPPMAEGDQDGNKTLRKAHTRDSLQALSKLGELVDGRYRIVSQPPVVVPIRELGGAYGHVAGRDPGACVDDQFREYRATLEADRRQLLERFQIVDMARKVVGVGSVGTRAFIVLLQGRDTAGPAVPAGQGGDPVGAGGPPAQEPVQQPGRAGGPRASG